MHGRYGPARSTRSARTLRRTGSARCPWTWKKRSPGPRIARPSFDRRWVRSGPRPTAGHESAVNPLLGTHASPRAISVISLECGYGSPADSPDGSTPASPAKRLAHTRCHTKSLLPQLFDVRQGGFGRFHGAENQQCLNHQTPSPSSSPSRAPAGWNA